jgi:hypothetical protein
MFGIVDVIKRYSWVASKDLLVGTLPSVWDFQEDGYAFTIPPTELQMEIIVKDIHGHMQKIPQLASDKSQKLLGVMKNPIGNQQDEIERLRHKSNNMAIKVNSGALSTIQAKMAYESFYLPAIRYSLAITSINQIDFESIQSSASLSILAALGFNRHMPREVVYGTSTDGIRYRYPHTGGQSATNLAT